MYMSFVLVSVHMNQPCCAYSLLDSVPVSVSLPHLSCRVGWWTMKSLACVTGVTTVTCTLHTAFVGSRAQRAHDVVGGDDDAC